MIQHELEMIGKYGCYLLSILHHKGEEDNVLKYYRYFLKKGFIDEECYVKDPVSIMKYITGNNYNVIKTTTIPVNADIVICYYYNPTTKLHHFVYKEKDGTIWDPLGNSNTVKNGYIESYRVFIKRI